MVPLMTADRIIALPVRRRDADDTEFGVAPESTEEGLALAFAEKYSHRLPNDEIGP
jgi:hypothetical protein